MPAPPPPSPGHVSSSASSGCSFPAIPEFHKKLSLLSFWTKCCSPVGVYHSSADRVIKQLEASFARIVNRDYPGLADPGRGQQYGGRKALLSPGVRVSVGRVPPAGSPAASPEKRCYPPEKTPPTQQNLRTQGH